MTQTKWNFSLQQFAEAAEAGNAGDTADDATAQSEETPGGEQAPAGTGDLPETVENNAPPTAGEPALSAPEADGDTGLLLRAAEAQMRERRARARAAEVLEGWEREAEALKNTYPGFSLKTALREGGDFARLLKAGVSLRRAYEAAHLEEILGTAMCYAARRAGQRSAELLRDLQARPQENPVQQRAATQQGTDVNSLTRNDILRILGEVSRGAKITFK